MWPEKAIQWVAVLAWVFWPGARWLNAAGTPTDHQILSVEEDDSDFLSNALI